MPFLLKNQTSAELHIGLAHLGVTPRAARQIQVAALRRGEFPAPCPGLSAPVIARAKSLASIPHLEMLHTSVSPTDAFKKYLFRGDGPEAFEAVRIPLLHRPGDEKYIVCVSSQVGCSMGCTFCATARMGLRRNLAAWEMVDQVIKVQADSPLPVRGVVFMGMGEPFLNYENVIRAAQVLSEPCGMAIAAKAISISTVGVVPGIRRFTREGHPYRLVVSLTSADPVRRRTLMPVEDACPTADVIAALRDHHAATGTRVTLAWVLIAGFNTREEDAIQLAELTRGLPVRLDIIDVNDPSGQFKPPSREELDAFRDALSKHLGMPVVRRYSGGQDIRAGCGMLTLSEAEGLTLSATSGQIRCT